MLSFSGLGSPHCCPTGCYGGFFIPPRTARSGSKTLTRHMTSALNRSVPTVGTLRATSMLFTILGCGPCDMLLRGGGGGVETLAPCGKARPPSPGGARYANDGRSPSPVRRSSRKLTTGAAPGSRGRSRNLPRVRCIPEPSCCPKSRYVSKPHRPGINAREGAALRSTPSRTKAQKTRSAKGKKVKKIKIKASWPAENPDRGREGRGKSSRDWQRGKPAGS